MLIQVLNVFKEVIQDRREMEKEEDKEGSVNNDLPLFSYIGDFMNVIGETEGFDFCIIFFGDKEKKCIEDI